MCYVTILVTGGAGFIGSHFIKYELIHHPEDRIICLDKLTYAGNLSSLDSILSNPNFRFIHGDICNTICLEAIINEEAPEYVVNFAAESHVDRSIKNPMEFMQTNIIGVVTLLNICKKNHIKRFHQVSTDEVYGELPLGKTASPFSEKSPLCASSPYSSSKAAADLIALSYHRTYGLPITISRSTNHYGPYHFPEKLIPLMIINAILNKPMQIYGNGENVRDWIYVEDHCSAIDLVLREGRSGEVYNIGCNNEMRNIDIVKLICRKLGKAESLITYVADRRGHDLRYALDSAKIKSTLSWTPKTAFCKGLDDTISWYLSHQKWWRTILDSE